jgi:uncharacterized OB-fold protein
MTENIRPLPVLEGYSEDFYRFCKRGELRFQRCSDCRAWRHVPREICAECHSWNWEWVKSSGRGEVFSYTIVARALHPAFADSVPYAPTIVEMEEGVRLLTSVVDVAPDELEIGMPVEVEFEAVSEEISLPVFRSIPS